ncbi:type II toxin-antitoxin system RelE/ParE family toxin [Rhizobacter sp. AJA081-3]|uniref:type II toxin-antitoxin system RelE/ParE family toxin n=1 Tax=Rhizobacter sp. AJA081-3 TaxID=2753607 RepID=UPI001ADF593C|nr:type II toxin-antitoxin system RelE/ParE family toxin [Rhizobacter sp. AJA081-3]QTN21524.1 type II toxin-antitoxin system RelE/ParE family toxin [Rhizobacter sp. AJA081-3]
MTRFSVDILPEAEAEFREAFLWYFERSPLAADAFRTEVFDKIDALATDANTWPKDEGGIHFRLLSRFPYTLHYDLDGLVATVLAVAHQRRLPGYWLSRAGDEGGTSDA